MLILLPLLSFGLLILIFRQKGFDWRRQILFASIPWALFLVLATEALSAVHFLTTTGVSLMWLAFLIATQIWLVKVRKRPTTPQEGSTTDLQLSKWDLAAVYFIALIAVLIGLTALLAAPNTWDSMEYHMPRVVLWMVNRGVQFYPTIDHQQLTMPPLAEYTILHLDLLYGGDRLANFVQWFSYAGCILGVTLIVEELGGDRRAQIFAAVLTASLPTAILGASGTKNDQVLAYWITSSVYLLVRWKVCQDWLHTLALGGALSLAAFTKGTAYTFLPLLVVACMPMWGMAVTRRFLARLPVFALILLLVSGPLWIRSYQFSGSIFGPRYFPGAGSEEARLIRNPHITPVTVAANVIRNISLDVGVPNERINKFLTRIFSKLIRAIGADPSDPSQIVVAKSGRLYPFVVWVDTLMETESSNPMQTVVFFVAGMLYLANFKKMKRSTGWLGVGIIGAFILYSAVVRWSPWNARYQLPLFVLAAAFVALVLPRVLPRTVILVISFLFLVLSLPFALRNSTRALLTKEGKNSIVLMPRNETYFLDQHRSYAGSFIAAADAVRREECHSIGLDSNLLHLDYPMLALLTADKTQRRLSYVAVHNGTERYKSGAEPPCIVVCLECAHAREKWLDYRESEPTPSIYGNIVVFRYPKGFTDISGATSRDGVSMAK